MHPIRFRLAWTKPTRVHNVNMETAVSTRRYFALIAAAERALGISKHASLNLNPHQLPISLSLRGNLVFTPANLLPRTTARSFKLYRRRSSAVEQKGPRNAPPKKIKKTVLSPSRVPVAFGIALPPAVMLIFAEKASVAITGPRHLHDAFPLLLLRVWRVCCAALP